MTDTSNNGLANIDLSEPLKQTMSVDDSPEPPPPYVQRSLLFWKNYSDDQNAYCATECCCRSLCCPCMSLGALVGIPWCIFHTSFSICTCEKLTKEGMCFCCCAYTVLDRKMYPWTLGTVGLVKYPEVRTTEETAQVQACKKQLNDVFCCPCNFLSFLCNTTCIQYIKLACTNCHLNCLQCIHGSWICCGMICRRCLCLGPGAVVT